MKMGLLVAAILLALIAVAHSVLGERYIIIRLFRRSDLPRLFGSDAFTKRTLRFAWHLTSVAWLGFAAILAAAAEQTTPGVDPILRIVAVTCLVTAAVIALASKGRHLAWPIFLAVACLGWYAARWG
jgi:hypothetical protein